MQSVLVISPLYSQTQHIKAVLLRYPGQFQIAGTADNSVLGMGMIESAQPDVVIMPVYMNFWNAEDLINYLLPRGDAPLFVLLQEEGEPLPAGAAAAQVAAVLPEAFPTELQLLQALESAGRLPDRRRSDPVQPPPYNQTIQHSLEVMELLMGLTPLRTGAAQMEFGRLRVGKGSCWLILCAPQSSRTAHFNFFAQFDDLGRIFEQVQDFLSPLGRSEICVYRESNLCVLLTEGQAVEPDWTQLCRGLNTVLETMGMPEFLFEVSDVPLPLERWHSQCQELLQLREKRFFYSPLYLQPKLLRDYQAPMTQAQVHDKLSSISLNMQNRQREELEGSLRDLEAMVSHSLSQELYSYVSTQLLVLHSRLRYSYSLQAAEDGMQSLQFSSVASAFTAFRRLFLALYDDLSGLYGDANQVVVEACGFINQNLAEPLTLEIVARRVHVSPTYLSRLFKRETGGTFNTYINKRRILRAMQLLETTYKITDIAGMAGFGNAKYFSQVFRKHTGMTPQQYRQALQKENTP